MNKFLFFLLLICLFYLFACSKDTRSADVILHAELDISDADFGNQLEKFSALEGFDFYESGLLTSGERRPAYRLISQGHEIAVVEPFKKGEVTVYIYRKDPDLPVEESNFLGYRLKKQVLRPEQWYRSTG